MSARKLASGHHSTGVPSTIHVPPSPPSPHLIPPLESKEKEGAWTSKEDGLGVLLGLLEEEEEADGGLGPGHAAAELDDEAGGPGQVLHRRLPQQLHHRQHALQILQPNQGFIGHIAVTIAAKRSCR